MRDLAIAFRFTSIIKDDDMLFLISIGPPSTDQNGIGAIEERCTRTLLPIRIERSKYALERTNEAFLP